jgi:AAA+ ATPase superfamily predicted ATPase
MTLFDLHPKESLAELFGRENEISELVRLIEKKSWVAVLGPRMIGKTSLIKTTSKEIKSFKTIYINLWGIKTIHGLLNCLVQGLNSSKVLLDKIADVVRSIEGVSLGPGGLSVKISRRPTKTLEEIFAAIGRHGGQCLIELDEVQELAPVSGSLLKLLANIFNTYNNLVFVFSGSMFGVMKTLLEPHANSPLYGRSPAKLFLNPFEKDLAIDFIEKGFKEQKVEAKRGEIIDDIEKLGGFPGWLALYGNYAAIRKLPHKEALKETIAEGFKIVRNELDHFLEGRDRKAYLAALKASAFSARWNEIKKAIELSKGIIVNDGSVYSVLGSLKVAMLLEEEEGTYRIKDPMLRAFVLS